MDIPQPDAARECAERNGRLCSINELRNGAQCRTGCGHDARLVWSGSACTPESPPPPHSPPPPAFHYWAADHCGPKTREACLPREELRAVRCCGHGAGSVCAQLSRVEAAQRCTAQGGRLCSIRELRDHAQCGTGCNHNKRLVWSATPCTPLQSPPPASPPPSPTPSPTPTVYYWAVDYCGRTPQPGHSCLPREEAHAVRCCGEWQGSVCEELSRVAAAQKCAAQGGRLCSLNELRERAQCGSGCGHDTRLVWSSNTCTPRQSPPPLPPPSPTPVLGYYWAADYCGQGSADEACLPASTANGVRCCGADESSVCAELPQDQAAERCGALNGRLCSIWALRNRAKCGTGCFHDRRLVWSRTACVPPDTPSPPPPPPAAPPSPPDAASPGFFWAANYCGAVDPPSEECMEASDVSSLDASALRCCDADESSVCVRLAHDQAEQRCLARGPAAAARGPAAMGAAARGPPARARARPAGPQLLLLRSLRLVRRALC